MDKTDLTAEQADFLSRLNETMPISRKGLPLADRAQDKVRQSCKRLGLAKFKGGWINGIQYPTGWVRTRAGSVALAESRRATLRTNSEQSE